MCQCANLRHLHMSSAMLFTEWFKGEKAKYKLSFTATIFIQSNINLLSKRIFNTLKLLQPFHFIIHIYKIKNRFGYHLSEFLDIVNISTQLFVQIVNESYPYSIKNGIFMVILRNFCPFGPLSRWFSFPHLVNSFWEAQLLNFWACLIDHFGCHANQHWEFWAYTGAFQYSDPITVNKFTGKIKGITH